MTPPNKVSGKTVLPRTATIREALGKTEILVKTGQPGTVFSVRHLQLKSLGTGPRPVAGDARRFDVSASKTWGTDLVAAARRDAHLVPIQFLGNKTDPTAPAFAAVGTSSKAGATLFGPRKSDNTMQASADMLSVVNALFFSSESMADIARRLQRSKLGVVINVLVEFVNAPDRMTSADELIVELESINALDNLKQ